MAKSKLQEKAVVEAERASQGYKASLLIPFDKQKNPLAFPPVPVKPVSPMNKVVQPIKRRAEEQVQGIVRRQISTDSTGPLIKQASDRARLFSDLCLEQQRMPIVKHQLKSIIFMVILQTYYKRHSMAAMYSLPVAQEPASRSSSRAYFRRYPPKAPTSQPAREWLLATLAALPFTPSLRLEAHRAQHSNDGARLAL